jgi:hypothetical protein
LFRKGLSASQEGRHSTLCKPGVQISYHPVLDEIYSLSERMLGDVEIRYATLSWNALSLEETDMRGGAGRDAEEKAESGYHIVKLAKLPSRNEYATSPPCRAIIWARGDQPRVENPFGVTVGDLVFSIVQVWPSEPAPFIGIASVILVKSDVVALLPRFGSLHHGESSSLIDSIGLFE